MNEAGVTVFLQGLVADVALARGEGDPCGLLDALLNAIHAYPVFAGWPTPTPAWLAEADELLGSVEHTDDMVASVAVRRAVLAMRAGELEGALRLAQGAAIPAALVVQRAYQAATCARIHVRAHRFAEAEAALAEATTLAAGLSADWFVHALVRVARAELAVERDDPAARDAVLAALAGVRDDLIEERIALHQLLAFVEIARADAKAALAQLEQARAILAAAGIQSEVLLMDLAVGSLRLALGDVGGAGASYAEARALALSHPRPELEPLLRLGAARAHAAAGEHDAAVAAALAAATAFAQRGQALGFVGVVSYLHGLEVEAGRFPEAYRILATGLSLGKRLRLVGAEALFRVQVNRLRDATMGPARFDRMVQEMIDRARAGGAR